MSKKKPKWMLNETSTRERSYKQETKLAKELGGRVTLNSGATFNENDIITDTLEIEAKTTAKGSFIVKDSELEKMILKCDNKKVPIMVIEFEKSKRVVAVIDYEDLTHILNG